MCVYGSRVFSNASVSVCDPPPSITTLYISFCILPFSCLILEIVSYDIELPHFLNDAMNMITHFSLCITVRKPGVSYKRVELLGQSRCLFFILINIDKSFSKKKKVSPIYTHIGNASTCFFLTFLLTQLRFVIELTISSFHLLSICETRGFYVILANFQRRNRFLNNMSPLLPSGYGSFPHI